VGNYKNEVDFLHQTLDFFEISAKRFNETLDNTCRHMAPHFIARWGINENLYILSLENQRKFLEKILTNKKTSIYQELKRNDIVRKVRQKYGDTGLGE
jgi:transcriptional antiterminator